MTDDVTPDALDFDLIGAIEGTVRPTKTVPFLFNEEAAQALANVEQELKKLLILERKDEYEALEPVRDKLVEDLKGAIFKVTLQSIPRKVKKAILKKVESKFSGSDAGFESIEYHSVLTWQACIVGFEAPDGRKVSVPLEEAWIERLLDEAPEVSISAVADAIKELETGPKAGFDQIVQGLDFLSER